MTTNTTTKRTTGSRVTTGVLRKVTDGRGHYGHLLINDRSSDRAERGYPGYGNARFGHCGPTIAWAF